MRKTHRINSHNNFPIYHTIMFAIVVMLYTASLELLCFITGNLLSFVDPPPILQELCFNCCYLHNAWRIAE